MKNILYILSLVLLFCDILLLIALIFILPIIFGTQGALFALLLIFIFSGYAMILIKENKKGKIRIWMLVPALIINILVLVVITRLINDFFGFEMHDDTGMLPP